VRSRRPLKDAPMLRQPGATTTAESSPSIQPSPKEKLFLSTFMDRSQDIFYSDMIFLFQNWTSILTEILFFCQLFRLTSKTAPSLDMELTERTSMLLLPALHIHFQQVCQHCQRCLPWISVAFIFVAIFKLNLEMSKSNSIGTGPFASRILE